jgi:uncharacterized membrane protein
MSEARLRVGIGALTLAGAGLSSYLLYVRWTGATLACSTGGCETVQASSYSKVLGIPVALLGLLAYTTIFVCSLFKNEVVRAAAFSTALAGVAFAAYLLYVQLAAIGAVCQWCLASDGLVTAVAVLTLLRLRAADSEHRASVA